MSKSATGDFADGAFKHVRDVFHANFESNSTFPEIGAAYAVFANGRCVADLWGGVADPATERPWAQDTLVHVYSTTKGLLAICFAMLAEEGRLSYQDRVADHWPEFAAAGKGDVTIAHVLSQQSGVNGFELPTTIEELADWTKVTERLAAQAPFWPPGEQTSYHAMTFGFILGEVARRVTGLMPRDLVAKMLADKFDLDVAIGAPEHDWPRIAALTPPPPPQGARPEMNPLAMKAITNPVMAPNIVGEPFWRRAQIPGVNGHMTAHAIARLWGAIAHGGALDGMRVLSPHAIAALQTPLSTRPDLMMGPGAWGAGVVINRGGLFGPGPRAFGNCGFGGSHSYADPDLGVGVGYTPNRMFPSALQDPRGMALALAVAECAGRAGS